MRPLELWLKSGNNRKVIITHTEDGWYVSTIVFDNSWNEEILGLSNMEPTLHKAVEGVLGVKIEKEWKYPWATLAYIWLAPMYFTAAIYEFMLPKPAVLTPWIASAFVGLGIGSLVFATKTLNQMWKRIF